MQDKSAMQQMIDWLQVYCDHQQYLLPEEAKRKATELLEVEEKNLIDAYDEGDISWMNKTAKEYYSTKYKIK